MYNIGLIAMTQVRDIMEKNVITIDKDKTTLGAATMLKEKEISFLVIMSKGKLSEIVSERDIVRKIAAEDLTASSTRLQDNVK
jgi:predicted transcriptional regulator